jgi:hypothetical protein
VDYADACGAVRVFGRDEEFGYRFGRRVWIGGGGINRADFDGGVEFAELFEVAEITLEGAFGGIFVAQQEVVHFQLLGDPIEGGSALSEAHIIVEVDMGARGE